MATSNNGTTQGRAALQQQGGERQRPAHEIRYGRVKIAIWRNSGKEGDWYSVALSRSYRDGQGIWKQAATLGKDDLLVAALAFEQAFAWISQQTGSKFDVNGNGDNATSPEPDIPF
ncbi:hypothetical protein [Frigoriglobus tundricola]|uniref:Uncharacterized protein n=1 Tax=Frigoriglobus tundricola TaxID=2774151 RepID=A0A6M5Z723_9BACT|nr:hypothetical protein [Frigoriglobus tundricola]QJX01161.1 hypothetical protein FTUN_8800 [Frigoriglobus tundricola]